MPSFADSVISLKIGKNTIENPEWWRTAHHINKSVKQEQKRIQQASEMKELYRKCFGRLNLRTSYKVVTVDELPSTDAYIKSIKQNQVSPEFTTYAPWNPIFRNYKTMVIFDK